MQIWSPYRSDELLVLAQGDGQRGLADDLGRVGQPHDVLLGRYVHEFSSRSKQWAKAAHLLRVEEATGEADILGRLHLVSGEHPHLYGRQTGE